jgi:long-chain acyl-CoA synthetase
MSEMTLAEAIGWTPPAGWPALSRAECQARLTAPGERFEMETVDIRGVPTRVWKNAPANLRALLFAAKLHGEREAFIYEDERVTFAAFHRAVAALARQLRDRGVKKGDRVAIAMRNLPEWPVAFFATVSLGAICVPLNAWWTGHELAYGLADSGTSVLITDHERWERIAPHKTELPTLAHVFVSRAPADDLDAPAERLEALIGAPPTWAGLPDGELPHEDIGPEDDATIFYTSGTTGKPKGALGTHRNLTRSGSPSFLCSMSPPARPR